MQKKILPRFVFVAILIMTVLVAFHSSRPVTTNSTCKATKCQCHQKTNQVASPGNMVWETLSNPFIAISLSSF